MEQKKIKIIIVDDDDMMRSIYAEVFKKADFEVIEAKDGLEGLEKATEAIPDVIFTGIIMPRMDGFDLMQSLKKNAPTAQIPVVISSHLGREEDKKKAMELGAKAFMIKDFDTPNEVLAKIKSFFKKTTYDIRIKPIEMDGLNLARDVFSSGNYTCIKCGEEKIMKIEMTDNDEAEFKGKFACPACG